MASSASLYQYDPLDPTSDTIRIVSVLPAVEGSILQLRLRTCKLDEMKSQYDAVSCMWGSNDLLHPATIDGRTIYLRDNIYRFFRHCRDTEFLKKGQKNLWVDAVCIDQSSLRERGHQVEKMGAIYRNARFVLIWLGQTSEKLALTFESCAYFQHMLRKARTSNAPTVSPKVDLAGTIEHDVSQILRSPYWRRLWIVQEVRATKFAQVVCGTKLVWFTMLSDIAQQLAQKSLSNALRITAHELECIAVAADMDGIASSSVVALIDKFSKHQCSEVRDHVFAVLGLRGKSGSRWEEHSDLPGNLLGDNSDEYLGQPIYGAEAKMARSDMGFILDYSTPLPELLLYAMMEYSMVKPYGDPNMVGQNALDDFRVLSQALSLNAEATLMQTSRFVRARRDVFLLAIRPTQVVAPDSSDIIIVARPAFACLDYPGVALYFNKDRVMLRADGHWPLSAEENPYDATGVVLQHLTTSLSLVVHMREFLCHWENFTYIDSILPGYSRWRDYQFLEDLHRIDRVPCSFIAIAELYGHLERLRSERRPGDLSHAT